MTGKDHGHLAWIMNMARAARLPDLGVHEYIDTHGVYGRETTHGYTLYKGSYPDDFLDGHRVNVAIRQLLARESETWRSSQRKSLTVIDCQTLERVVYDSLGAYFEHDATETDVIPARRFDMKDENSLYELASIFYDILKPAKDKERDEFDIFFSEVEE